MSGSDYASALADPQPPQQPQLGPWQRMMYALGLGGPAQPQQPIWPANNPVGTSSLGEQSLTMPSADVSPLVSWLGQHPVTAATQADAVRLAGNMLQFGPADVGAIRAFHGSPYSFERFDPAFIGAGEGNQAFGHGLYFAEKEGTAGTYRDMDHPTMRDPRDDVHGIRMNWQDANTGDMRPQDAATMMRQYPTLAAHADDPVIAGNVARYVNGHNPDGTVTSEAMFALRALDKQLPPAPKGSMYEVALHADPEHFLDWDKPLSEQSQHVRDAIARVDDFWADPGRLNPSGQELYKSLAPAGVDPTRGSDPLTRADAAARMSQSLREAGIPGIRYLDASSRGAGQGTSNYVVFSPETIEILRRYGIAGLIGGGAAAGAASGGNQQQ